MSWLKWSLLLMISVAVALALAACGGGVSEEEMDAVERDLQSQRVRVRELEAVERDLQSQLARVEELEAKAAGLQQRLNQGAAIFQVIDTIFAGLEEEEGANGPSAEAFREFTSLVQASGNPALQAKWVEIIDSVLAEVPPLPLEAVAEIMTVVQATGNVQLGEKLQEFLAAVDRGEGGTAFLELDAAVHASKDPTLKAMLIEPVWVNFLQGEPPGELIGELIALAETSGNKEVQQAFFALGGSPAQFFEEIGAKVKAVGDPSLDTLFEKVSRSSGAEGFDAFFEGLFAEMNRTLGRVETEVQR